MCQHQTGSQYVAYNMDCMTSAEEGGGSMPQHQTGSLYVAYNMDCMTRAEEGGGSMRQHQTSSPYVCSLQHERLSTTPQQARYRVSMPDKVQSAKCRA